MKHGILAQHTVSTADTPEQVYTFGGNAAYQLLFTNPAEVSTEFDIAYVPQGETLAAKHWMILKHDVQNWEGLSFKFLAAAGDVLYVRASAKLVSVHVNGIEL